MDRSALLERKDGRIVRGRWAKADLWISSLADGRRVVIKDFRERRLFARWWGRLQIRRECAVLETIQDLPHVVRLVGVLDRDALVLEYVDHQLLHLLRYRQGRHEYLDQLRRTLDLLQRRGVLHNDLRGKGNILVGRQDGKIVLIDWAGAMRFKPGGVLHALLFRWLRLVDEAAFLKWKRILVPESLTLEDRRFQDRFRRIRALWRINKKGIEGDEWEA